MWASGAKSILCHFMRHVGVRALGSAITFTILFPTPQSFIILHGVGFSKKGYALEV